MMMSTVHQYEPRRRPAVRRALAVLLAAGVVAALGTGVQPARAEAPWLTVSGGFATFTIPNDYVSATFGSPQLLNVEGNFGPAGNWSELGLSQFGGAWTATIGPLAPGAYYYRVAADDGRVVLKDPTNPTVVTSRPAWSTFFVPGDSAGPVAEVPGVARGSVGELTWTEAGRKRSATVWTPPGYDARARRPYPVLYLQPGADGGSRDWVELGRAGQILDNTTAAGRAVPMIVVMGDGPASPALLAAARGRYRIARDGAHQAIAGAAAGGSAAVRTVLEHPGAFAWAGSFSGTLDDVGRHVDARAVDAGTRVLRLYTGNVTDPAHNATARLVQRLGRTGVRHEFDGVNPALGGNWTTWQDDLADFLPRLFRPGARPGPRPGHLPIVREFRPPATGTSPTPWLSHDARGNTFATFETGPEYAAAQHVTVWGNTAPGGAWLRVPLERAGDRWRGTVGPLRPGLAYYQFIVDLVAKKDPANPTHITTEPNWSTFIVPGPGARLLTDVPQGRGGQVEKLTYTSSVAGGERTAYVWTPPGYDARRATPYPVLYLQHGGGQHYTDWVEMGRAKQILDHEYLDGDLVPMVVVMGEGNVPDFTRELLENIVPAARARYHVASEPSGQALAGLSMGGFQTFEVLRTHPGEFAYVGTFSAALQNSSGIDVAAVNGGTKLLRIYTGNVTDFVYPFTMSTLQTLDGLGIHYEFAGLTPGPHGWDTWQKNLIDFAPRLFRDGASAPR
jgi:enterochelin esterase-like enzyme